MNKEFEKPKRIQRKRTKGWRLPENTVYVGRPSDFGNPFRVTHYRSAKAAVDDFKRWLSSDYSGCFAIIQRAIVLGCIGDLRGKNLACWCKIGEPCHADVLLEMANR